MHAQLVTVMIPAPLSASTPQRSCRFGSIQLTRLGLALIFLAGVQTAKAELAWAQKTVEVTGDASSPQLEARFQFTNTGKGPVEIRKIESSCGCTTAALEKRIYRPQESGEILARYTVGSHTGTLKKTLLVSTDDGNPPLTLTLVAHIPEILRITPFAVSWSHAEALKPKTISLELLQKTPFNEISVESSNAGVSTELVAVIKGRKYQLLVTPKQTGQFLYAKVTIRCRFGNEEKSFITYATVKPATDG